MKYFITDGTPECFFTAVFEAYRENECIITSQQNVQLDFSSEVVSVSADEQKCGRVKQKIAALDRLALHDIDLVLRSYEPLKEQTAFEYIRLLVRAGVCIRGKTSEAVVMEMERIRRHTEWEIDKMRGLLRFMENSEGVLYAPCSPQCNIIDLLAQHFARRFGNLKFVIHDVGRAIAAMFDGQIILMVEAHEAQIHLSAYEQTFEHLWRQYYNSVNIESRPHERQMRGYMPVRYWKFLPEKK